MTSLQRGKEPRHEQEKKWLLQSDTSFIVYCITVSHFRLALHSPLATDLDFIRTKEARVRNHKRVFIKRCILAYVHSIRR